MKQIALFLLALGLLPAQVPYERIRKPEPGDWLTYSGNYQGHRFSSLREITSANVARLKPVWVYQVNSLEKLETSPLALDGVVYLTEPMSAVTALDARTGRALWSYTRPVPADLRVCCGNGNRGPAVLGDTLFFETLDAHLVALDARNGAVRWDVVVADYKTGHSMTAAPLAIDGKVIVGIAGGEFGVRGFIDAYDAKTGKQLWRFWTIPGPGEAGHETWPGDDRWKTGGATTWVTGSYDPKLNLVYWGTGNPGPDWNGDVRAGDNLYSCSLLALDAETGKLKWHFQFTPHDDHDWDANHVPVLFDASVGGRERKLVAMANRNAFYYVLDRETGEFLAGAPYAKQTWAKGLDERGRPMRLPGTAPTAEGTLVYPSLYGATNWFSPSFNPESRMFYVAVREMASYYYKAPADYSPGLPFIGGGERTTPPGQQSGAIRALDALTGKQKWEFRLVSPPWAGVVATAGNLVFGSSNEGNFFALDAQSGKPLWQFQTGGQIWANPVSFSLGGKQYVSIAAGHALYVFGL